jgi:hypothetical protein
LPAPAGVEVIELPAPEAEEVKAALRELRASAMRTATSGEGAPDLSEAPDERSWFVVHCYSGYENKVRHNLEQRIATLSEQGADTTDLEEILDELVFALESSGVEQFRPEVNSDYNGKEKIAEVVKDKAYPKDPNMKGKIAEVIKPGYHYVIDDANVNVSGASTVTINLDGRLDASVSGASTLSYIGDPEMGTINVSGASTLRRISEV